MRDIYPSFITNGRSVIVEIILGSIGLFFIGSYLGLTMKQYLYWILPFSLPFLLYSLYKYVKSSESISSEVEFKPRQVEIVYITVLWFLSSGVTMYRINLDTYLVAIPILLGSLYLYRLHIVNSIYSEDIYFYTDKYSRTSTAWVEAAAAMTKSVKLRNKRNPVSILWAIIGVGRYIRLYRKVDANRDEYELQGAEEYVFAARQNLKSSVGKLVGSDIDERLYLFRSTIESANNKLQFSRCDSCGSVHRKENMTRVLSEDGIQQKIVCNNCDSEYVDVTCPNCERTIKKSERVNKYCIYCEPLNKYNTSSKRTTSQKYRSTHKEYTHSSKPDVSLTHNSEIETARSILDIEKPITRNKVINSYRDKAKKTHPDTPTGSEEEFKKVQESKKTLLEHLNTR